MASHYLSTPPFFGPCLLLFAPFQADEALLKGLEVELVELRELWQRELAGLMKKKQV